MNSINERDFVLSKEQIEELKRLKQWFPYRIVFGVIDKDTNEFTCYAKTTKHTMNSLARKGHKVYQLGVL